MMPAICRFFLKGNCRYGANCRFEHPGESDQHSSSGGGFSFAKALEEVSNTNSSRGFSFKKALEVVDSSQHFAQQYNQDSSYFNQNQHQAHNSYNTSYFNQNNNNNSYGYDASPFRQQYNQHNLTTDTGFSFRQALETPTSFHSNFNSNNISSPFGQTSFNLIPNQDIEIDMRSSDLGTVEKESLQLDEIEIKAYQSDKFSFRLIPVRPPPQYLC